LPAFSIRRKALRFQPTVDIARAEETALPDGHGIIDMYAAVVFGLLGCDNRVARGTDAVFKGLAVGTQRKVANIRRIVCHRSRSGSIRGRTPHGQLAIHQGAVVDPAPVGRPHDMAGYGHTGTVMQ